MIPLFNQENTIREVLVRIIDNVLLPCEIILIDDASEDLSNYEVRNVFDSFQFSDYQNIISVSLFRNRFSRFETWCDDFGIKNSNTDYCIEIQADMFINDIGFDKRMLEAMLKFPDLAIISGRGVEPLSPIISSYENYISLSISFGHFVLKNLKTLSKNIVRRLYRVLKENKVLDETAVDSRNEIEFVEKNDQDFMMSGQAGRLGMLIENRISDSTIKKRRIYIGDTLMRGPLFLNRGLYLSLNGFDTRRFFLGFDDHDYCARVLKAGFKAGYTPVSFDSPLSLGSTRKERSIKSEVLIFINLVRIRVHRRYSELFIIWEQRKNFTYQPEIRDF